jgi:hypothetical protein
MPPVNLISGLSNGVDKRMYRNMRNINKKVILPFFSACIVLIATAVNANAVERGVKTVEVSAQTTPVPPRLIKEDKKRSRKTYEVFYKFQEEQWNDPDVLSTPRIQFSWQAPEDGGERSIWSMRLDGTDLRQVVSAELVDTPKPGGIDPRLPFVRSPNNRYVAVAVRTCFSCSERRIIDLETKEVIVAPMGGNNADFQWMPDSKSILFNAEGLVHFNLETRKGEKINKRFRKDGRWGFWYLIEDGTKIIVSIDDTGYIYDFETGKLLDEIPDWWGSSLSGNHASYDRKYMVVRERGDFIGFAWAKFFTPNKPFEEIARNLNTNNTTMTYGAPVYKPYSKGIWAVYPKRKKHVLYLLPGYGGRGRSGENISLYNVHQKDLAEYYKKSR